MVSAVLQAIFRRSCKPVKCWEQFAEIAVAVLRDMMDALPAGSTVSMRITETVYISHLLLHLRAFASLSRLAAKLVVSGPH